MSMFPPFLVRACAWSVPLRFSSTASGIRRSFYCPGLGGVRCIATHSPHLHLPSPPPREFNPDGSPKVYRLTQTTYSHKYDWERWHLAPVGVFHSVYRGQFAKDSPPLHAWLLQYNMLVASIPLLLVTLSFSFMVTSLTLIGIKPKRFTRDWMLANKERERAENSNPMTRYLDRRRKERGPNWVTEKYLPTHPFISANISTSRADLTS